MNVTEIQTLKKRATHPKDLAGTYTGPAEDASLEKTKQKKNTAEVIPSRLCRQKEMEKTEHTAGNSRVRLCFHFQEAAGDVLQCTASPARILQGPPQEPSGGGPEALKLTANECKRRQRAARDHLLHCPSPSARFRRTNRATADAKSAPRARALPAPERAARPRRWVVRAPLSYWETQITNYCCQLQAASTEAFVEV